MAKPESVSIESAKVTLEFFDLEHLSKITMVNPRGEVVTISPEDGDNVLRVKCVF